MNKTVCFCLLFFVSCSMLGERSYLSEMDDSDQGFFEPRSDFPVMAGDSGRAGRTYSEVRKRAPASNFELRKEKESQSMKQSLDARVSKLSDEDQIHYQKYKKQLGGDSERLYFLDLPTRDDRDDYLMSRGLMEVPLFTQASDSFLQPDAIDLGMTKDDVNSVWGTPVRVDVAGNPRNENERWIYRKNGALKYVYFESGRVGGWSTERP